jgi:hypothetical protein
MMFLTDFQRNAQRDTNRGPSPAIWADCPVLEFIENPGKGFHIYEDFARAALLTTPTITTQAAYALGYKAFGSSGGTLVPAGIEGGSGLVATESDNNEGVGLASIALPVKIARGRGDLWFEARLKTNSVANDAHGIFVGLIDSSTLSATVPIAADGTLADENFVGFHRLEGDGDQIDTVFKADGQTQVSLQSDVLSSVNTVAGALAADTYTKLGMRYRSLENILEFYVNNVKLATTYAPTSTAGNPFPNDVQLGFAAALLCASNDDAIVTLDYYRLAQRYLP